MGKIVQQDASREMEQSYIDYSMSVITDRALPDVRDGMKPVHRRIMYGMSELGITPDKPHKKSARIVGEVMGKYHPHGDSSIYNAMVRLAQDFSTRYPLVDGHGNFGSIDGDGAAAMRYTEARMSPFSLEMIRDIRKDCVDFIPNYDGEEEEPSVLPSRFPNLLVNGSNGIAVGMATSIPPHNLGEVIDACAEMIDGNPTIDDICKIIKGPDFPTGAHILGKKEIQEAYKTGQGKITVRAVAKIEETSRGRHKIVFSEIPYQVNKGKLLEKMGELVRDKKIDGISAIRDESSRKGMQIVVELKNSANPNIVLNRLYKNTQLQDTFSIIMLALVNGQPKILNIHEMLSEYLKHQKEVVTRRTKFDLERAEARLHILNGYIIALDNIDEVIKKIRSSHSDAKEKLIKKFSLSEIQAQSILDMRLARLQGLEREKIEKEHKEVTKLIKYLNSLLESEKKLMGVVKDELLEIKEKWGDKRRTAIKKAEGEIDEMDLVEQKSVVITLTEQGYVKRVDADTFSAQRKGGKGVIGAITRMEDFVTDIMTASTHDRLMLFTNIGKVHFLKAYEIPEANRTGRGTHVANVLSLVPKEKITAILPCDSKSKSSLLFATKNGVAKRTAMSEYDVQKKSIIGIKLKDNDELISIKEVKGSEKIILVTEKGKSIAFSANEVSEMGRAAIGVKGITLDKDDKVVAAEIAQKNETLLIVTSKGYGKRTPVGEFRRQARGGKGVTCYDRTKFEKTGLIVSALSVSDSEYIFIINEDGNIIKTSCNQITSCGRTTMGGKIMSSESEIAALAKAKE